MMCRTARRWVYLTRAGELSETRARRLASHLARCPQCSAEAAAASGMERDIARIRAITPAVDDPEVLTLSILRAAGVRTLRQGVRAPRRAPQPAVQALRWACGLAVIALTATFAAQVSADAARVARLEARLSQSPAAQTELSARILRPEDLSRAELVGGWNPLAGLDLLGHAGGVRRKAFLAHIASRYPRLASVRIDDGIDDRERIVLATEGAALAKELESYMRAEGSTNGE